MKPRKSNWFGPAKYVRGGIRVTSWQGAATLCIFILLFAADVISYAIYNDFGLFVVFGVALAIPFAVIVIINGGRPNSNILN
jgi:hypothetical protein